MDIKVAYNKQASRIHLPFYCRVLFTADRPESITAYRDNFDHFSSSTSPNSQLV